MASITPRTESPSFDTIKLENPIQSLLKKGEAINALSTEGEPLWTKATGKMQELFKSSIQIADVSKANVAETKKAVKKINELVGWQHYTGGIQSSLLHSSTTITKVNGEINGYVQHSPNYVPFIAVDPRVQNQKLGTALMFSVLESARESGSSELYLDFRGNNPKTKAFYQKIGNMFNPAYRMEDTGGNYSNGDPRFAVTYFLKDKTKE